MEICLELRPKIEVRKEEAWEIDSRSIKEIIHRPNEIIAKKRSRSRSSIQKIF